MMKLLLNHETNLWELKVKLQISRKAQKATCKIFLQDNNPIFHIESLREHDDLLLNY